MNDVVLLLGAQSDLLELYARQGDEGYFLIDKELETIRRLPEIAPVFSGNFRRRVVPGTPFGIFYAPVGSRIMVSAILDLRQDPQAILKRLR